MAVPFQSNFFESFPEKMSERTRTGERRKTKQECGLRGRRGQAPEEESHPKAGRPPEQREAYSLLSMSVSPWRGENM